MSAIKTVLGMLILWGFLTYLAGVSIKRKVCGQPKPYDVENDA